ncbi:TIGR04372 family glycosyltransferase [SAR202 cluster bacterium AD-812-D07_MRT_10900m]|nr:TIGR04372 family glycosyltransferase [SAR202 cluster bacterium AD-812-D07_MRT_10900m]
MDRLIDYAVSQAKTDWMDIFIIGCARFLLSSNSGPCIVAKTFGVPVAAGNWIPVCQGTLGWQDIRMPKMLVSKSQKTVLSFYQVFRSDLLRDINTKDDFTKNGIEWQDNTAEEIRELALEMMDQLDGIAEYESLDIKLQHRFQELVAAHESPQTYGTISRIGRHFLRTHEALLEDDRVSS